MLKIRIGGEPTQRPFAGVEWSSEMADRLPQGERAAHAWEVIRWNRHDWVLLILLTGLAALLRFYGLGTVPPGFQFDEAYNALDVANVLAGNRPLFLPLNGGREVVYTYLQAGLASLLGLNVYTLRLTSALAGILAVPVCYVLLRVLLRSDSRRVAAFTSLALAISYWHLHFSHYGIRVILMPVIFSGICGTFWWGCQTGRAWPYLIAGALTGLSGWTHPAGRLIPFVLVGYTLWLLWQHPSTRPQHGHKNGHEARSHREADRGASQPARGIRPLPGLLLTGLVALLVFLPLGLEFYRHPDFFLGHASGVSVFAERVSGGSPLLALSRHMLAVIGMFSLQGDRAWIHNLAGRPVFDPLLSIPFWIGLLLWIRRLFRRNDPDRDALALLLIWSGAMLLPTVFSDDAPNFSRSLPALPALFVAVGLGLTWIVSVAASGRISERLRLPAFITSKLWPACVTGASTGVCHRQDRLRRDLAHPLGVLLVVLMVVVSGALAVYDFFVRFPARAEAYYAYDVDKLDAWQALRSSAEEGQIYLSQLWAEHATLSFLRLGTDVKSFDSSETMVMPPLGQAAVYAFPAQQQKRAVQTAELWPGAVTEQVQDRYGQPLLYMVKVGADALRDWPAQVRPAEPLEVPFTGGPALLGMKSDGGEITLFWRAGEPTPHNLTSFLHLVDAGGRRVGQADMLPGDGSYLTPAWTEGERIIQRYRPALDPCLTDEPVEVLTGWYDLAAGGARLPRADAAGDTVLAGQIRLPLTSRPLHALQRSPDVASGQRLGADLTLIGYDLESQDPQAGSPLKLNLYWQGDPADARAPLSVTLAEGAAYTLWQGPIVPNGARWQSGEVFCRRLETRLPTDAPAGHYELQVTLGDEREQRVSLNELELGPSTRRFDVPPVEWPLNAQLGDAIRLIGANVAPLAPGQPLTVTLVWQALASSPNSHQVFVHLVGGDGKIVAQSDAIPALQGPGGPAAYPTNFWVPGEVVADVHTLQLPPEFASDGPQGAQAYRLYAGMYDPLSGKRLPAQGANGQAISDDAVYLGEVEP
jgi:hypothetical protein